MTEKSSIRTSSGPSFLGWAAMGAGAYHGFCDAQGMPITPNIEWALTYAPTIVTGTVGAVTGGLVGLVGGGAVGGSSSGLGGAAAGAAVGTVGGAALVGGLAATVGAVKTLFGYGVGYFVGYLAR